MKKLLAASTIVLLLLPFASVQAERTEHEVVPLQVEFTQGELEQMLAPIALYPDTLLSHILIAATYPLEIIQAERWSSRNPDLTADEINIAIEDKDWDPSVKALVPFPKVLQRMSNDIDWTQNLGDAFLQDEAKVLAGIQSLRADAETAGNLDNIEHLKVTREEQTIVIEPARREVVYVPYYDPRIVYGSWRWNQYPPVYWDYPGYVSYPSNYYPNSLFYWGPRVHISFGFGFSAFNWHNRHVVVLPHSSRYRYYSRRQIIHNQNNSRWQHNPRHRRGASYRTSAVSTRYQSNRQSRSTTRIERSQQLHGGSNRNQASKQTRHQRISNNIRQQTRIREPQLANRQLNRDRKRQYVQPSDSRITPYKRSSGRNSLDVSKEKRRSSKKYRTDVQPRTSKPTVKHSNSVRRPDVKRQYSQPKTEYRQPKQYRAPEKSESSYKPQKRNSSSHSSSTRSSSSRSSSSHSNRSNSGKSRGSSRQKRH